MKKKFNYHKSVIALVLAATMVVGEGSVVMAEPGAASGVSDSKSEIVGNYSGDVSKVIGLEENGISNSNVSYSDYIKKADGTEMPYYYVNPKTSNTSVKVCGNYQYSVDANGNHVYNKQSNNFYSYGGTYYASAEYDKTNDITTFSNPVTEIIGDVDKETLFDANTGLYTYNGNYYSNIPAVNIYANYTYVKDAKVIVDGNHKYTIDADGNKTDILDQYGFYTYNGKSYGSAEYTKAKNSDTGEYTYYTVFYDPVCIIENLNDYKDDKNRYTVNYYTRNYNGNYFSYYYVGGEMAYCDDTSAVYDNDGIWEVKKDHDTGLYMYNGKYYGSAFVVMNNNVPDYIKYSYEVNLLYTTASAYTDVYGLRNKIYGCYLINGMYYSNMYYRTAYSIKYVNADSAVIPLGVSDKEDGAQAILDSYKVNADGTKYNPNAQQTQGFYYNVNGTLFSDAEYKKINISNKTIYAAYTSAKNQIQFGDCKMKPTILWNALSATDKNLADDGKQIKIAYEIMVDGQLISNTNANYINNSKVYINSGVSEVPIVAVSSNSATINKFLGVGESVTVQVRGIYYTQSETKVPGTNVYNKYTCTTNVVYKVGPWSDPYTYTRVDYNVDVVRDLSASIDGSSVKLNWTAVPSADSATMYQIDSLSPLDLSDTVVLKKYLDMKQDGFYDVNSFSVDAKDGKTRVSKNKYSGSYIDPNTKDEISGTNYKLYPYHYYVMKIDSVAKGYKKVDGYSNIAGLTVQDGVDVPQVSNLHIERLIGGNFNVAWTKADSNAAVIVYAYEKSLPDLFNYAELNAKSKEVDGIVYSDEYKRVPAVGSKLVNPRYIYLHYSQGGALLDWESAYTNDDVNFYSDYVKTVTSDDGKTSYVFDECDRIIDTSVVKVKPGEYYLKNDDGTASSTIVNVKLNDKTYENYYIDTTKWQTVGDEYEVRPAKYLSAEIDKEVINKAKKVYKAEASYSDGSISCDSFKNGYGQTLKPGKKYYFVAYTYDKFGYEVEKTPLTNYEGIDYVYYNAMSAPSKVISAKKNISATRIYTSVKKNSIKLTFATSSNFTGYIVYRKNSKGKYVKIATTTNNEYTDTDVKLGKEYTYKVVTYYYDPDSNTYIKSNDSAVAYATPSSVSKFNVEAAMTSTSKVKLSWTKVSKATKYEIYRIKNANDGDYKLVEEDGTIGQKWKLVKTIKKASKTSYIDKVTAGADYQYWVVAYFKEGGKEVTTRTSANISMELQSPQNIEGKIKGNKAVISWDADKFAKGYEVTYTVYDKYGVKTTNIAKVKKTSKNSITISGVVTGGSVSASVRAYDKSGKYSSSESTIIRKRLACVKNIKASYNKNKKAVKISWKAVKGAVYYRVFRSTTSARYDADEKKYYVPGTSIAASGNDNESNDYKTYNQYMGVDGSIVGTTAYDYYDLEDGVKYYYTVIAYGERGTSICSAMTDNNYYASSKPASVVNNPSSIKITKIKNQKKGQAQITYTKVKGARSYIILRSTKKNGSYKQIGTAKKTAKYYTDKSVKKGKTYYYKVIAVTTNGLKADTQYSSSAKVIKIKK